MSYGDLPPLIIQEVILKKQHKNLHKTNWYVMTFVMEQFPEIEIITVFICPEGITKASWHPFSASAALVYAD